MTAPFPTRSQEEWRYADLDALQPVWEQLGEPLTLDRRAGESSQQVWLPTGDDVQCGACSSPLGEARRRACSRSTLRRVYGRIELDVSAARRRAISRCTRRNIGGGESTLEIVTNVRHVEPERGRSRQTVRSVLGGKATGSFSARSRSRATRSRPTASSR